MKHCRYLIAGKVQGVGYRAFLAERARSLGVSGFVRNLPDGRVEAEISGAASHLEELERLMRQGPGFASVASVEKTESGGGHTGNFEIRY